MPSTYTPNGGIQKPGNGEQSGTWGTTANTNYDIIDRLVNGVSSIPLTGYTVASPYSLTTTAGTLSAGQFLVITFTGSPSVAVQVNIAPQTATKLYFFRNSCGQTVTIYQGSGATVSIPNGYSKLVYTDGAGATASVQDFTAVLSMSGIQVTGGTAALTGASSVTANSSSAALTITQTGAGNALVVEDDTSPDSTPFIVDATGKVGIGTSPVLGLLNLYAASNATFYVSGDAATSIVASRSSSDTTSASLNFRKYRGTTAAPTAVASGDVLGTSNYTAWDGDTLRAAAQIASVVDTFVGADNLGGFLQFFTRPNGAAGVLTERLRIASAGQIGIGGANYGTSGQTVVSGGSAAAPAWGILPVTGGGSGSDTGAGAIANYGITASITELNYVDGVTSAIQGQLDGKQATNTQLTQLITMGASGTVKQSNGTNYVDVRGPQLIPQTFWAAGSGTSNDWTSFPAGITEIEVIFDRSSSNTTARVLVQMMVGGVAVTTGYTGGGSSAGVTAGFAQPSLAASSLGVGKQRITRRQGTSGATTWIMDNGGAGGTGSVTLAGEVTGVRVLTDAGSFDTPSPGGINVAIR